MWYIINAIKEPWIANPPNPTKNILFVGSAINSGKKIQYPIAIKDVIVI
jgi:hypothetical protein